MNKIFIYIENLVKIFVGRLMVIGKLFIDFIAIIAFAFLSACGGSKWDDIDYSRVRGGYDNDSGYSMPSIIGCISDDLFDCN